MGLKFELGSGSLQFENYFIRDSFLFLGGKLVFGLTGSDQRSFG